MHNLCALCVLQLFVRSILDCTYVQQRLSSGGGGGGGGVSPVCVVTGTQRVSPIRSQHCVAVTLSQTDAAPPRRRRRRCCTRYQVIHALHTPLNNYRRLSTRISLIRETRMRSRKMNRIITTNAFTRGPCKITAVEEAKRLIQYSAKCYSRFISKIHAYFCHYNIGLQI